jgi:uncharacterized membrane protein (UPF0127 family)
MSLSRTRTLLALAAVCLSAPVLAQPADAPQFDLPRIAINVGMYRIDAQLATTPEQRETGLMYRQDMPQSEGMLFVFSRPSVQCFWMKNTLIPLTAAFVADDGLIVNLADMAPQTETSHCSTQPVRYVLEMNQGWFEQRHLKAGAKLHGPAFDAAPK